jgi:hypothetical protein
MMHGFGVAPQIMMGGLLGSAIGARGAHGLSGIGGAGMAPAFAEMAQMMPQQWFGDTSQLGQQTGAQMGGVQGGLDPAYAAYMPAFYAQQQLGGGGMQGYPFSLPPPAFGRQW